MTLVMVRNGAATAYGTVTGQTLDQVDERIEAMCRPFFGEHAYAVVALDVRPLQTYGGGIVTWTAEFAAEMQVESE